MPNPKQQHQPRRLESLRSDTVHCMRCDQQHHQANAQATRKARLAVADLFDAV